MSGIGCPVCGGSKQHTTESFILKATEIHGNNYDYSLSRYENNKSKIKIICKIHGEYEQNAGSHLLGNGCYDCCSDGRGYDTKLKNTKWFIDKSNIVHKCKYLYNNTVYKNIRSKVIITCPLHGDFMQSPQGHLNGRGCPSCKKTGFDVNSTGFFYIQELIDGDMLIGYKFGITKDIKKRVSNQRSKSKLVHNVIFSFESTGMNVFKLEQLIKSRLVCNYLDKSIIPDGYTETLSPDYITEIENIVLEFLLGEINE